MKFPLGCACRVYMKYKQTSCLSRVTPILRISHYTYASVSRAREISSRFPTFHKRDTQPAFQTQNIFSKGDLGECNSTLSQGATAAEETVLGIVTWPSVPASKRAGGVVAGVRLCGTVQVGLTAKSGFSAATLASLDQRLSLCAVSLVPSLV